MLRSGKGGYLSFYYYTCRKYYRLLGNKKWEPYEYVYKPADAGGDQHETESTGDEAERT